VGSKKQPGGKEEAKENQKNMKKKPTLGEQQTVSKKGQGQAENSEIRGKNNRKTRGPTT